MKLKNIIFDLGGIIIDINPLLTVEKFNEVVKNEYVTNISDFMTNFPFLIDLELGLISENDFFNRFNSFLTLNISENRILDIWNAMLLDFPAKKIELLEQLKSKYNIFLLSNTNIIHKNFYCDLFQKKFGYNFESIFIKAYYSFDLQLAKPNREIFEYVINEQKILANETLFIDDSEKNIDTAKALGFKTFCPKANTDFSDFFENNLR